MRDIKKVIKVLKIDEIKPNPLNPKAHNLSGIKDSIEKLGYIENIHVDEDNVILAGHGRFESLKDMGVQEVEVTVVLGLNPKEKRQYLLRSNQLVISGGWDEKKLKEQAIEELKEAGFITEDKEQKKSEFYLWVELASAEEEIKVKERLGFEGTKRPKQIDKAKLLKVLGL